jgi:hypothetical protein
MENKVNSQYWTELEVSQYEHFEKYSTFFTANEHQADDKSPLFVWFFTQNNMLR